MLAHGGNKAVHTQRGILLADEGDASVPELYQMVERKHSPHRMVYTYAVAKINVVAGANEHKGRSHLADDTPYVVEMRTVFGEKKYTRHTVAQKGSYGVYLAATVEFGQNDNGTVPLIANFFAESTLNIVVILAGKLGKDQTDRFFGRYLFPLGSCCRFCISRTQRRKHISDLFGKLAYICRSFCVYVVAAAQRL